MDIKLNQLSRLLDKNLPKIMLISGDETILCNQALDTIRNKAKKHNYNYRQQFDLEQQWSWQQLTPILQQQDLFAENSLIEINNAATKFDKSTSKIITESIKLIPENKKIIISCGKLTAAQAKSKWYRAIGDLGITLRLWPLNSQETLSWMQTQLDAAKIKLDRALMQNIISYTQNNLTDIKQLINKLCLYDNTNQIKEKQITELLTNHLQLNVFELTDAILDANLNKVTALSSTLDHSEPKHLILLNWALGQMVQRLLLQKIGKQNYIPMRSTQMRLQKAATRYSQDQLTSALQRVAKFDLQLKGCITDNKLSQKQLTLNIYELIIQLSTCSNSLSRDYANET
jgi:DNA polymerase III subunit delta